jgi:hypothetical protein
VFQIHLRNFDLTVEESDSPLDERQQVLAAIREFGSFRSRDEFTVLKLDRAATLGDVLLAVNIGGDTCNANS